jgi:hypothetical protein
VPVYAEIIDVSALGSVILASLIAGAGLTLAFSVVIVCTTRAAEARRAGSTVTSVAFGFGATLALLACVALVVFGLNVMVSK